MLEGRGQRHLVSYRTLLRAVGGIPVEMRKMPGAMLLHAASKHMLLGRGHVLLVRPSGLKQREKRDARYHLQLHLCTRQPGTLRRVQALVDGDNETEAGAFKKRQANDLLAQWFTSRVKHGLRLSRSIVNLWHPHTTRIRIPGYTLLSVVQWFPLVQTE